MNITCYPRINKPSAYSRGGPFYQQLITILMATPHLWSGLTPIRGWPHHFTDEMQPVHHFQLPHPRWRQVGNYSTAKKRTSGGVSENGGTHKGMVYNGVLTSISGNPQMAGHLSWILWPRIHSSVESPNPSLFHPVFWCHWEGQAVVPSSDTPHGPRHNMRCIWIHLTTWAQPPEGLKPKRLTDWRGALESWPSMLASSSELQGKPQTLATGKMSPVDNFLDPIKKHQQLQIWVSLNSTLWAPGSLTWDPPAPVPSPFSSPIPRIDTLADWKSISTWRSGSVLPSVESK